MDNYYDKLCPRRKQLGRTDQTASIILSLENPEDDTV